MHESGFQERLDTIAEGEQRQRAAEIEHAMDMERVSNFIKAVASDEFSLDLIQQNPEVETGAKADEVTASVREKREALDVQVEAAVASHKSALHAQHQVELNRNRLFSSGDEEPSSGDQT